MNLPEFSVKRPTTVIMIILAIMIMGVVSLFRLPVELYPNTNFGEISIVIYVRGQMPPVEVEAQVTRLVEEAVSTVSNLRQILSITKEGESTVILSFEPGTDMEFGALEVREKFARIKNKLPKEIEKPIIAQYKQTDVPVMIFALTSPHRSPEDIRKIVDEWVKERFKRVSGVANVEVAGGRERKILVEIDQQKMVAYEVTKEQITNTLSANNLNLLSGEVERVDDKLMIRLMGEFESIKQIEELPLKSMVHGSLLRLNDVATVKDGFLDAKEFSRLNVQDTVTIYIQKESTGNTITVVDKLLKETEVVKEELPKDIQLVVTSNQATFIEDAIGGLKASLMRGAVVIFLVLFLFLFRLNWILSLLFVGLIFVTLLLPIWATYLTFLLIMLLMVRKAVFRPALIVVTPMPVAVVATFLFMRFSNLTLNVMTLFGLALGVGMLVDNSIVVFDNILKKREKGEQVLPAVIHGSQELLLPIIASTLTTVIVFLPMIFMSKEIQLMYSSMAITVVFSLVISLICALTIVPLMASKNLFAKPMEDIPTGEEEHWLNAVYPRQKRFLFRMIRHSRKVIAGAILFFVASLFFASKIPTEYLGSTEQNKFTVFIEMPTGAKLDVSNEIVKRVEEIVKDIPELKTMTSRVEAWSSKLYVELVPPTQRKRSVKEVIDSLRPATSRLEPAFIYFEEEEQVGTKDVTVEVFGYDYKLLRQLAIGIVNRMETIQGLTDLKIRMREGRPEMRVLVDKHRAASMSLTTQAIADQVHGAMRGLRATLFREQGKEVETITRLQEKYRKTFRDLHKMVISNAENDPILLDQVADFRFDLGPSEIWRKNRDRMIQVSGNLGKLPLSDAADLVHERLADLEFPEDYYYRIGGDYDKLLRSQSEMRMVILMVIVLVYLVLASLFESFFQPILIMLAVPLALGGAVLTLYMGPRTIGIGALLGLMMLAGIVVNHSIMLMDRINYYQREIGYSPIRATILSNRDRLRPILLTTCTTILGLIPMAIDKGQGANMWSPLALTVIGGLISSMVLTLAVMPSFFLSSLAGGEMLKSVGRFFLRLVRFIFSKLRLLIPRRHS